MKFVGPNITRISSTDEKDWSKKVKWPAPDQTVVSKGTQESEFKLSGYWTHHFLLSGVKKLEHVDLPFLITYIFSKKSCFAAYSTNLPVVVCDPECCNYVLEQL